MQVQQLLVLAGIVTLAHACSNFMASSGATEDGSTFVSYSADAHNMYGFLDHYPAADHKPGDMHEIHDYETGDLLGEIPEANHTYNVVGFMNEFGVTIGETTYGGVEELCGQDGAIIDYGSLMSITLQRSKTAREAIVTMTSLANEYGYASEGESFSIGDPNEVWHMDLIGKGNFELGVVWVAIRAPEGYVGAHANQARITTWPRDDPDNVMWAEEIVDFAKTNGFYPESGKDEDFDFTAAFNPLVGENVRGCEARVWSAFQYVTEGGMDDYLEYAKGLELDNRMPLFVKPTFALSLNDTKRIMRDHFEGTWFDFRSDVGAQAFNMPYRWRPLTFDVEGKRYINERSIATQQTAFGFVGQMRAWLPAPISGILWFTCDDTATAVYAPMYGSMSRVPHAYAKGNGDLMDFSFESAFWVFNLVANWAYMRYELIYPEIAVQIFELEDFYQVTCATVDSTAADLYSKDPAAAVEYLTTFSEGAGNDLVEFWGEYWKYLVMKYLDGNVKYPNPDPNKSTPVVEWPGYPDEWYARIVDDAGAHYLDPDQPEAERATAGNSQRVPHYW